MSNEIVVTILWYLLSGNEGHLTMSLPQAAPGHVSATNTGGPATDRTGSWRTVSTGARTWRTGRLANSAAGHVSRQKSS